jgi:23S rRNA pseudouridine1911/1915/1917 synthase
VEKVYDAVVHGRLDRDLTIDAPLGKDERSRVAIRDCVRPDGAPARTDVRPIAAITREEGEFTHVEARPRTGRKHQIRIHLAHAGHPIVGDKIYGLDEMIYLRFVTRTMTSDDEAALILPHHALHARRLAFPWRGRRWEFESPGWRPVF